MELEDSKENIQILYTKNNVIKIYNISDRLSKCIFLNEVRNLIFLFSKKTKNFSSLKKIIIKNNIGYIYLRKIDGFNLKELRFREYTLKNKIKIFNKILDEVYKLHSLNVIHGDICLSNILYNNDEIHLIDFSESIITNKIIKKEYISYNRLFSPIEKYSNRNKNYYQSDIFNLLLILYYILYDKYLDPLFINLTEIKNKEIYKLFKKGLNSNYKLRYKNIKELQNNVKEVFLNV